jgi:hypothetical protein
MKEMVKAISSLEVKKKAYEVGLNLLEIAFNSIANPTQPINPSTIARIGSGVTETYYEFRNQFINEKIATFFSSGMIKEQDLKLFMDRLGSEGEDFIKRLITIIEREDEKERLEILGKIFAALVYEKISVEDYRKATYSVTKVYLPMLKIMVNEEIDKGLREYEINGKQLSSDNLMWEKTIVSTHMGSSPARSTFEWSDIGQIVLHFGFGKERK